MVVAGVCSGLLFCSGGLHIRLEEEFIDSEEEEWLAFSDSMVESE